MSTLYKKVLVPLDGSELAAQALPHAEEIAHKSGATLILFRVIETPTMVMATVPGTGVTVGDGKLGVGAATIVAATVDDEAHRHFIDEAQHSLGEVAKHLRHQKLTVETDIALGDPASHIVDYATAYGADLIVMSTHGRTGIARWTYGSVANKVLQSAPCPVFVVRPPVRQAK